LDFMNAGAYVGRRGLQEMLALFLVVTFVLLTVAGAVTACWALYDGVTKVLRKRVDPEHEIGA
jgi:hypothetical protein